MFVCLYFGRSLRGTQTGTAVTSMAALPVQYFITFNVFIFILSEL